MAAVLNFALQIKELGPINSLEHYKNDCVRSTVIGEVRKLAK